MLRPFAAGASVTGASHARDGTPCQDRFAHAPFRDGLALAVADGLGSAARAGEGAALAVDAAVAAAASAPHDEALEGVAQRMAGAARAALDAESVAAGCDLRDLACTLVAIAAVRGRAVAAHVGDGAAVVVTRAGLWLLSGPEPSEYVNEVVPLTAPAWRAHLRVSPADGALAIAAFTDGCERAALRAGGAPSAPFFGPVLEHAAASDDPASIGADLAALLSGPKMSEHSDDDKTLVVAVLDGALPRLSGGAA